MSKIKTQILGVGKDHVIIGKRVIQMFDLFLAVILTAVNRGDDGEGVVYQASGTHFDNVYVHFIGYGISGIAHLHRSVNQLTRIIRNVKGARDTRIVSFLFFLFLLVDRLFLVKLINDLCNVIAILKLLFDGKTDGLCVIIALIVRNGKYRVGVRSGGDRRHGNDNGCQKQEHHDRIDQGCTFRILAPTFQRHKRHLP